MNGSYGEHYGEASGDLKLLCVWVWGQHVWFNEAYSIGTKMAYNLVKSLVHVILAWQKQLTMATNCSNIVELQYYEFCQELFWSSLLIFYPLLDENAGNLSLSPSRV